jgi:hypothetical protein
VTGLEEKQIMIKKWIFYTSIVTIVAFISTGFKPLQHEKNHWFFNIENEELLHLLPSTEVTDYSNFNAPHTGKSFTGFKEAIAFKESQGQFKLINSLGYMGKYQFGIAALRTIGINNTTAFLNNPGLQELAFVVLLAKNKWELKDEIEKYDGKVIKGIKITESGILAAAHLGGAGSVKKFLKTKGNRSIKDNYGTSLKSYLKKYGGYDTSFIVADNDANVKNK